MATVSASTTSDTTSANCLASSSLRWQSATTQRADARARPSGLKPGASEVSPTTNQAPTTTAAPTNIDSAYERTKPVWSRRTRPDVPPISAARPLTRPSTPRLSKNTASRVSHWPGRMNSASFSASPYRSARANVVRNEPRGAVTRHLGRAVLQPGVCRRRPRPARASTRPGTLNGWNSGGSSGAPTTGREEDHEPVAQDQVARRRPIEPTDSTISGTVITAATRAAARPRPTASRRRRS